MDDRLVPPQNLQAEEAVLGAMMLSPGAIGAVAEVLDAGDFYRDSHAKVYLAALHLNAASEPVDAITLTNLLEERGELDGVGGRTRLHELAALVPATANAAHYARIVHETATLRGLIRAGGEIQRLGWERPGSAAELMEQAEQVLFGLTQERARSQLVQASAAVTDAYRNLVALAERGRDVIGTATGYRALDDLTSGLQPGNLVVLAARPSMGKAQPLDAGVLTPQGWRAMGAIRAGDLVIGADGRPHPVLAVHDRGLLSTYRVTFDDGSSAECCADHLWTTTTRDDRRRATVAAPRPTSEIAATLRRRDGQGWNHAIPWVEPVAFDPGEGLPLDPWLLGFYLAEGDYRAAPVRLSNPEPDLVERAAAALPADDELRSTDLSHRICSPTRNARSRTSHALDELGLRGLRSHEKFVPDAYLRAPWADRLALLQGICDGDGYVDPGQGRSVELSSSSPRLADDVAWLVRSLGGRVTTRVREVAAVVGGVRTPSEHLSHRMTISFPGSLLVPVSSAKHVARWRPGRLRQAHRFIVDVAPSRRAICRCLTVEGGHYVTDGFAVTHNSGLALGISAHVTLRLERPAALFTLEMSTQEVMQRLLSQEAFVDGQKIRNGRGLTKEDWQKISDASGRIEQAPLFIDDSGLITVGEIASKARRLKMRHPDLGLLVVDYLQLMAGGGSEENRNQEISRISRALKILARDLEVPVLALSQLSRAVESRHDKRPILSDLRDSGAIEQDADVVLFIYRDEYYNPEETDQQGIAEVNVAKQRNGPTNTVKLSWQKRYARFGDLAAAPE